MSLGIAESILDLIGQTPLLHLSRFAQPPLADVYAKIEWLNPHMRVYIDVTDPKGTVANWNLELTSPNTVRRQGWGPKDLLPGEKVVFEAYGGKVIETRGALARIAKVESPDKPLFIAGGPEQPGFPKQ